MEELYRNTEKIQSMTIEKEKDVNIANRIFDELRATGLILSHEMLSNLFHNRNEIINEADRQLKDELKRLSKFHSSLNFSSNLTETVKKIVGEYKRDCEYIIVKKGRAEISDNFYKMLEESFVVKIDTPQKKRAYELANNVIDSINELESYMKKHGDGRVHGICVNSGLYNRCLVALSGDMDKWEWTPKIYPFVLNCINK